MAANDGEDDDNSTPPSDDELERDIVRWVSNEDEKQAIANFIQLFHFWNRDNPEPKPFPQSIQKFKLLPTCVPEALPEGDDRFAERKKERVFVCDVCGETVRFSSFKKGTDPWRRTDCEFAGSFSDRSWDDIPAPLRRRAYDMRLINASWTCTRFCGAEKMLGQRDTRNERTLAWTLANRPDRRPYNPQDESSSSHQPPRPKRQKWW